MTDAERDAWKRHDFRMGLAIAFLVAQNITLTLRLIGVIGD